MVRWTRGQDRTLDTAVVCPCYKIRPLDAVAMVILSSPPTAAHVKSQSDLHYHTEI